MKHQLLLLLLIISSYTFAQQGEIKGIVKDAATSETIIGASITYATGKGVVTDVNGNYSIKVDYGDYTIAISMIGYAPIIQKVKVGPEPVMVNAELKIKTLDEVEVVADVATTRETPVAFSNISTKQIQEELGTRDLPMLLNATPGAYATEQGGGAGDARINIRGFDQRYVAVMVDGVPVNDMENGQVYWSNWDGLGDITRSMQVQRGLGASKLAIPSIGGTINIITKGIDQKMSAQVKQEMNDYGLYKTSFGFNSGNLKGNWGVTLGGSYKWGTGWADETYTKAYSYFFKVQKRFKKHLLSFSVNGAPQEHGQRLSSLPVAVYSRAMAQKVGVNVDSVYAHSGLINTNHSDGRGDRFNQDWGMLNGKPYNAFVNFFHKPAFNLSHFWSPNDKVTVSTVAYLSIGTGGGTNFKTSVPTNIETGQYEVQSFYDENVKNISPSYSTTEHAANNYLRAAMNKHIWYGVISSIDYRVNKNLTTLFGVDLRYYKGTHYQTPYDLMGADYALDNSSNANQAKPTYIGDPIFQQNMKRVGDKVSYYNDAFVKWGGLFAQAEYKKNKWTTFLTGSFSETGYQRIDYFKKKDLIFDNNSYAQVVGYGDAFYYNANTAQYLIVPNGYTPTVHGDTTFYGGKYVTGATKYTSDSKEAQYSSPSKKWYSGYTIKAGANYNINDHHNVYINIGYMVMPPRMNAVYDNNNRIYSVIDNQKVYAAEGGYGIKYAKFNIVANVYYTYWKNKPFSGSYSYGGTSYTYNLIGLNALHKGFEIVVNYKLNKKFSAEVLASLADWKLLSGSNVEIIDQDGKLVTSFYMSAKNVHVGDAAQFQYMASVRYDIIKGLYFKPRYTYFAKHYANFTPDALQTPYYDHESWKLPNYGLLDLFLGYDFDAWKMKMGVKVGVTNVLNTEYISDGVNGLQFNASSSTVYMGLGRRITVGLRVGF